MFVHLLVGHLVEVFGEREARADRASVAAGAVPDPVHLDAEDHPGRLADGLLVVGPELPAEGEQRLGERLAGGDPAGGGEDGGVVEFKLLGLSAGEAEFGRDLLQVGPAGAEFGRPNDSIIRRGVAEVGEWAGHDARPEGVTGTPAEGRREGRREIRSRRRMSNGGDGGKDQPHRMSLCSGEFASSRFSFDFGSANYDYQHLCRKTFIELRRAKHFTAQLPGEGAHQCATIKEMMMRSRISLAAVTLGLLNTAWLFAEELQPRQSLKGHEGWGLGVAFSPDGKSLASSGQDGTVRLWNLTSGKEVATLKGHTDFVWAVAFSPDGKSLASAGKEGTVRIWDVASGRNTATLKAGAAGYTSIAFHPQKPNILAAGNGDTNVQVWDVTSGKITATLEGHKDMVWSVAFSPDGKTLASGSHDKTIRLWDVATNKNTSTLTGHTGQVSSVAFSADGRTLASGSSQSDSVRLWDVATGKNTTTLTDSETCRGLAFDPKGGRLVTVTGSYVTFWDVKSGAAVADPGRQSGIAFGVAFSPDGSTVASSDTGGEVLLWTAPKAK